MSERTTQQIKWDRRFLQMAETISTWSKDPSTKCGAVIVDQDNRIISLGYNGFPKGVIDKQERLEDRMIKYEIILHAEENALLFARTSLKDCSIYTWPFLTCSRCASKIIQVGIKTVISAQENVFVEGSRDDRWKTSFELAEQMYLESNVRVLQYTVDPNGPSS